MRNNLKLFGLLLFFLFLATSPLLAQEASLNPSRASLFRISLIVGGAIITITAAVGALAQAKAISSACEGLSRNPGSGPYIRFVIFLGLVLIETLVIYSFVVTILIVMIQWGKYT